MSIKKTLADLDFPDGIKITATEIINNIRKKTGVHTRKGKNDLYINFFGIYHAYNIHGKLEIMMIIAHKIGITRGEITKALNKYSEIKTGIRMEKVKYTHMDYIIYCCNKLRLKDQSFIRILRKSIKQFDKKNPNFKINRNSLAYAVAYIRFFILQKTGNMLKSKVLKKKFMLCETVINTTFNKIGTLA